VEYNKLIYTEVMRNMFGKKKKEDELPETRSTPFPWLLDSTLRHACKSGNLELVLFLIEEGANVDPDPLSYLGPTLSGLEYAVLSKNKDMVEVILKQGVNSNKSCRSLNLSIETAAEMGDLDTVKRLLEYKKESEA